MGVSNFFFMVSAWGLMAGIFMLIAAQSKKLAGIAIVFAAAMYVISLAVDMVAIGRL